MRGLGVEKDRMKVSHLQYADDLMLFLQHDNKAIRNALTLIQVFGHTLELKINLTYSDLIEISVEEDIIDQTANQIGCIKLKWAIIYLGLPLGQIIRPFGTKWNKKLVRVSRVWKGVSFLYREGSLWSRLVSLTYLFTSYHRLWFLQG